MEPTLVDGQGLFALRTATAKVGQLRCLEHPQRPGFWLVKRVEAVFDDGTMLVLSDNRSSTLADSRPSAPCRSPGPTSSSSGYPAPSRERHDVRDDQAIVAATHETCLA